MTIERTPPPNCHRPLIPPYGRPIERLPNGRPVRRHPLYIPGLTRPPQPPPYYRAPSNSSVTSADLDSIVEGRMYPVYDENNPNHNPRLLQRLQEEEQARELAAAEARVQAQRSNSNSNSPSPTNSAGQNGNTNVTSTSSTLRSRASPRNMARRSLGSLRTGLAHLQLWLRSPEQLSASAPPDLGPDGELPVKQERVITDEEWGDSLTSVFEGSDPWPRRACPVSGARPRALRREGEDESASIIGAGSSSPSSSEGSIGRAAGPPPPSMAQLPREGSGIGPSNGDWFADYSGSPASFGRFPTPSSTPPSSPATFTAGRGGSTVVVVENGSAVTGNNGGTLRLATADAGSLIVETGSSIHGHDNVDVLPAYGEHTSSPKLAAGPALGTGDSEETCTPQDLSENGASFAYYYLPPPA